MSYFIFTSIICTSITDWLQPTYYHIWCQNKGELHTYIIGAFQKKIPWVYKLVVSINKTPISWLICLELSMSPWQILSIKFVSISLKFCIEWHPARLYSMYITKQPWKLGLIQGNCQFLRFGSIHKLPTFFGQNPFDCPSLRVKHLGLFNHLMLV